MIYTLNKKNKKIFYYVIIQNNKVINQLETKKYMFVKFSLYSKVNQKRLLCYATTQAYKTILIKNIQTIIYLLFNFFNFFFNK